jgi:hypothetical protein
MLTQLPLGGSQYLKMWYDEGKKRPCVEFMPIDNVLLPYGASNFYTAQRVTEMQTISEWEFDQRVSSGLYRDINLIRATTEPDKTYAEKANNKIEGRKWEDNDDGLRKVYHIYTWLTLDDDSESDGDLIAQASAYAAGQFGPTLGAITAGAPSRIRVFITASHSSTTEQRQQPFGCDQGIAQRHVQPLGPQWTHRMGGIAKQQQARPLPAGRQPRAHRQPQRRPHAGSGQAAPERRQLGRSAAGPALRPGEGGTSGSAFLQPSQPHAAAGRAEQGIAAGIAQQGCEAAGDPGL